MSVTILIIWFDIFDKILLMFRETSKLKWWNLGEKQANTFAEQNFIMANYSILGLFGRLTKIKVIA